MGVTSPSPRYPAAVPTPPEIDGFALGGRLGTGRRSAVWAAVRSADGLAVALKTTPVAAVADATDLLRMAERLAGLDHPHVLRCHGIGRCGEHLWLALERASGSLASEATAGPLAPAVALAAGRDAAAGLTELHRLGLVHGRIRPSSLLRLADGRLVVAEPGTVAAGGAAGDLRDLGETLRAVAGPAPGLDAIIAAAREGRYRSAADLGEDCTAVLADRRPGHALAVAGTKPLAARPPRSAGPALALAAFTGGALLLGVWWLAEQPGATPAETPAVEAPGIAAPVAPIAPPAPIAPVPPVAPAPPAPPRPPVDLAAWTIAWDAPEPVVEPPPGAAAIAVHPLPMQRPGGVGWSRREPGGILLWDSGVAHFSSDGGASWRLAHTVPPTGRGRSAERTAAWAGDRVLLAAGDSATFGLLSRDRGRSFTAIPLPPGLASGFPDVHGRTMLADGSLVLAARLADGSDTLLASGDAGVTWSTIGAYAADRFGDLLPLGATAGLLRCADFSRWSGSADRGVSWSGFGESRWIDVATWEHGGAQHLLLGSTLVRWTSQGVTRAQLDVQPLAGPRGVAIDPRDPLHVLVGGEGGLMRSADGGRSWSRLRRGLPEGVCAMDLIGRERPRLAVATRHNLLVLDLANPGFAALFQRCDDLGGALRLDPPGNQTPGLAMEVAAMPGLAVVWNANQVWSDDGAGSTWRRHEARPHRMIHRGDDPSGDAAGRHVLLPDDDAAWLLDRGGGPATRLPSPWGATLPSRYAVPPIMRPDGSIVAAWMRDGASTSEARRCTSRDLGRSWSDDAVIPARRWTIADATAPLLVYVDDGLHLSLDLGSSELPDVLAAGREQPVWGVSGGRLWAIDSEFRRLNEFDPATRTVRQHPVARPPIRLAERFALTALAVDPADPRRLWLRASPAGLIHSPDAGRSWLPVRADVVADELSGRLVFVSGPTPWLLLGGVGCAWRLDLGPGGAGLFADWGAPIP